MSASTGLELRKAACEALGWTDMTIHEIEVVGYPPGSPARNPEQLRRCPHIEELSGDSEPMFLEWAEKRGWMWGMSSYVGGVVVRAWNPNVSAENTMVEDAVCASGKTPSEARARAIAEAYK